MFINLIDRECFYLDSGPKRSILQSRICNQRLSGVPNYMEALPEVSTKYYCFPPKSSLYCINSLNVQSIVSLTCLCNMVH